MTASIGIAVIGLGAMGAGHARRLADGLVPGARLAAVVDRDPVRRSAFPVPGFADLAGLIGAGAAHAVVVATPHRDHPVSGAAAISAGLHALIEKPLAPTVAEALPLVEAARRRRPGQVCAAGFNQRTDPRYQALRRLLREGTCGSVQRIAWCVTDWFRTGAYYASAPWRGTWAGEGGGLLINQCPHQLDMWCWLFGRPERVQASIGLGRWHGIEVEDEVAAIVRHGDGTLGTFTASTGETPGLNRLEVACDRGLITLDSDGLRWRRTGSAAELRRSSREAMPSVQAVEETILPPDPGGDQHAAILADFAAAIAEDRPPLAPLEEGLASLDLANAILAAAVLDRSVSLPVEHAVMHEALRRVAPALVPGRPVRAARCDAPLATSGCAAQVLTTSK